MIALLLSILSSTVIFVVFKLFDRFKVHTLQAIVVNYWVACCCGILFYSKEVHLEMIAVTDWFPYAVGLGLLFIAIFNLMAITAQRYGLSVVSVATKMSVVIPILFGLFYYKESLNLIKVFGIILALQAVYLVSVKKTVKTFKGFETIILPSLVFIGSGIIDTSLKYLEDTYVDAASLSIFSATIFGAAGTMGFFLVIYLLLTRKTTFKWRNLIGGIALGVPNYFSVYFLIKALKSGVLESSGIFTVNNVAIVMLSTLIGIGFFTEKLSKKNWLGITLAVVSIVVITLAEFWS